MLLFDILPSPTQHSSITHCKHRQLIPKQQTRRYLHLEALLKVKSTTDLYNSVDTYYFGTSLVVRAIAHLRHIRGLLSLALFVQQSGVTVTNVLWLRVGHVTWKRKAVLDIFEIGTIETISVFWTFSMEADQKGSQTWFTSLQAIRNCSQAYVPRHTFARTNGASTCRAMKMSLTDIDRHPWLRTIRTLYLYSTRDMITTRSLICDFLEFEVPRRSSSGCISNRTWTSSQSGTSPTIPSHDAESTF
jgi:hypothetical protein